MNAQKKLEPGSQYEHYDLDGDGIVSDEEMKMELEMMRADNEDKKEAQIRRMAWFALWGLLIYPVGIVVTDILPFSFESTSQLLADIAPTYFVSVSALVGAFFGAQAYQKAKGKEK
jgi:FtsH-binding integral membrane protein